jgi:hypothetical protein
MAFATRNLHPTALLFSVGKMLNLSDGFVRNGYAKNAYKCLRLQKGRLSVMEEDFLQTLR